MAAKIQDADVKGSADVTSDARLINDNKIYVNSLSKRLDQAIVAGDLAGGGVGGVKNYLTKYLGNTGNGDFEANATTGWSLFNTTLTNKIPTGAINSGAASITTFATTATNKLAGAYSLNTASSAAWSAGQGFLSSAFTIDAEDQAKPIQISCSFSVQSGAANGNFSGTSSNTFAFYVYDVTNSAWIQPAGVYSIAQSSGVGFATGTFQTSSNGTQYRLAVICITATSGAISMNWDDFVFSPVVYATGAAITDWVAFTPTGDFTTNTTYTGFWRRVGDSAEIQFMLKFAGAPNAVSLNAVNLPSGLVIDTARIPGATNINEKAIGFGETLAAGNNMPIQWNFRSTTSVRPFAGLASGTYTGIAGITNTVPATYAANDYIYGKIFVPIVGWSSNSVVSSDTDTRVCSARYSGTTEANMGNISNLTEVTLRFNTRENDSHGIYNASNGLTTIIVPGTYRISSSLLTKYQALTPTQSGSYLLYVTKNGSGAVSLARHIFGSANHTQASLSGSCTIDVVSGDVLRLQFYNSSGQTVQIETNNSNNFCIERISGPSQIAASEAVYASARNSSGQSIANNSVVDWTGWTIDQNSHGALATTGVFTAPVSGQWEVFQQGGFNANGTGTRSFRLQKNGSDISYIEFAGNAGITVCGVCVWQGRLNAGDTIKPQVYQNSGGALGIHVNDNYNKLIIKRIGN